MGMLKAVFWDIDGTIADTEMNAHRVAFNQAFKEKKINWMWDKKIYQKLLSIGGGKNRIKFYANKKKIDLSESNISSLHLLKTELYKEIISSNTIPFRTGVINLIQELYLANIIQIIVTTSSKEASIALLNKCIIKNNSPFKFIVSGDDVKRHKPDPEPYLKAINISRLSTNEIIVIEDSVIGLSSATAAKLKCLVTLNDWCNYSLKDYKKASTIVDSLGSKSKPAKFLKGPVGQQGIVDLNYLQKIICLN